LSFDQKSRYYCCCFWRCWFCHRRSKMQLPFQEVMVQMAALTANPSARSPVAIAVQIQTLI
jgi:hypothetical protein